MDEVHFQQHGSRCRMWIPPEVKDPVLLHHPTRKSMGYFGAVRLRDGKFVFAQEGRRMGVALDSIVAGGSVISGGRVQKSVIGNNVRVNSYSEVSDSIIYNHVNIGRHSRIRRAIIDRHVSLPERTEIGYDLEADRRRFHVSDSGIVVVVRQESLIEEPESA